MRVLNAVWGATAMIDEDAKVGAEKRRRFLAKLTILTSGGMFIDGFILGGIGTVMPSVTKALSLSLTWQGLIGASALIGIFIGGPLGGYLADRVGRKPMFTIDLAMFLIGSIAQFFVASAGQLFAVRVLMGIAIGADYAIGWPLLAEFAPARQRGKLLCIQEVGWYTGFLISYALGWALIETDIAGWNVILGLSTIPTIIVLLLRLGTPESPRWLMSQGRTEEAIALANEYMEADEVDDLRSQPPEAKLTVPIARLFSADYAKATAFASLFWVCNTTPYFAIGTFAPVVLEHLGLKDGLTGGLALNGLALLGTFTAVALIERIGRRKLAISVAYMAFAALMIVGLFPHAAAEIIVASVLIFSFANAVSNTMTSVFSAEVFPTEVRGSGVGFATAVSRVGAAAGTVLLPESIAALGTAATMLIAAAICFVGLVVTQIWAPETKGKHLSETGGPSRSADLGVPAGKLTA